MPENATTLGSQALIKSISEDREASWPPPRLHFRLASRDIAEILPMLIQAASLAGFEQTTTVRKEHLSVHQEKSSALNHVCASSQVTPAARTEIAGQEQGLPQATGPESHIPNPALAAATDLISLGTGRERASNEDVTVLLCPWQAAAQGNNLHHLFSPLVLLCSQFSVVS